jgi:hypothetical protein
MARLSLDGFRDPVRRPRFILWTFASVCALAAVAILVIGATSTRWFCAFVVCHRVQSDTIAAYKVSSHSEISCMACHEPVNADTYTLVKSKLKNALGMIPTLRGTYSLPLNPGSALALEGGREMGSQQCLQCHSMKRHMTPTKGIVVNHAVHEQAGVWCTVCHNRIAHNDTAAPPTLVTPAGVKNVKHPDFMKMDACFRCHDLRGRVKMTGAGAKAASGECETCHPKEFERKPASHRGQDWAAKGHEEAARLVDEEYGERLAEAEELVREGIRPYLAAPVKSCETCHVAEEFCEPCHDRIRVSETE